MKPFISAFVERGTPGALSDYFGTWLLFGDAATHSFMFFISIQILKLALPSPITPVKHGSDALAACFLKSVETNMSAYNND